MKKLLFIFPACFLAAAFFFFGPLNSNIALAATCVWNSHGSTDMNLASNYWTGGSACPMDTTADLQFTGTSTVKATATGNLKIGSITTLPAYSGTWSISGYSATSTNSGGLVFNGTGTTTFGVAVTLTGANSVFRIGHGAPRVNPSGLININNTGIILDVEQTLYSWGSLTVGANDSVTASTSVNISSPNTPLVLGNGASLTVATTGGINFYRTTSGDFFSLGTGYSITANNSISFWPYANSITVNIPTLTIGGSGGSIYFENIGSTAFTGMNIKFTGLQNYGTHPVYFATTNATTQLTINLNGQVFSSGALYVDPTVVPSSGYLHVNYGSSTASSVGAISVASYSDNNHNFAATENFGNSQWNVAGNWTFGSNHTVVASTSQVTFTNTATIHNYGKSFHDVAINDAGSGKIITLYDNLTAHNLNIISAKKLNASSTITTIGGNLTIATSTTFNHLIMSSTTARTITVAAGKTLTLTTLTASDLNGQSGGLNIWRSGTPTSQFNLNIPSPITLTYQNPQDCSVNHLISAYDGTSVDGGNNVNWMVNSTIPTITSFTMPATANTLTVNIISFTATDTVGVIGYLITSTSSVPSLSDSGWSGTHQTSFAFAGGSGAKTAYAWVKNASGNISSYASAVVIVNISPLANVYYSVGSTTPNMLTGSPTITITNGAAVFSIAQTGNIGVGDRVIYNGGSIAYISAKTNTDKMHWNLVTATGGKSADVSSVSVTSITRTFATLSSAIAGASGASYLNNTSLVLANAILNIPCYYDGKPDTTYVNVAGYTTASSTYIKIYTPFSTSTEANQSQRYQGVWDNTKYRLEVTDGSAVIDVRTNYVRIIGLQLKQINVSFASYSRAIRLDSLTGAGGYIVADSNIVQGQISGSPSGPIGIANSGSTANPTFVVANNIVYGFVGGSTNLSTGIYIASGKAYIYNNTIYNVHNSYKTGGSASVYLKNNIAQNDDIGFVGFGTASSTNNISDHADAPGLNSKNSATVSFVDTANKDFHLRPFDTTARLAGVNLSADAYYSFSNDVDEETRPSVWDIGADQFSSTDTQNPVVTAFTMPATASSTTVTINSFTATDNVSVNAYMVTESSSTPYIFSSNWSASAPSLFVFSSGTGIKKAYAWARDSSSNISASAVATVNVSIPASSTPTYVYYSVGQLKFSDTGGNNITGLPTITISNGTATFSVPQTGNIGVGDRVTYNTNSVAYISGKIDQSNWTLVTANGGVPANVVGQTVNSIGHEFSSLNSAISGASNSSHLNNTNLVAANIVLNIPCYYDNGPDTAAVSVSGFATDNSRFIKIYTPFNTATEANQSQRHSGKWTNNAYRLEINETTALGISVYNATIDGLQIKVTSASNNGVRGITTSAVSGTVIVSNNIVRGVISGANNDVQGIINWNPSSNQTYDVYSNIVYDFNNASSQVGRCMSFGGGAGIVDYVYNNTVYNCYRGIVSYTATTILKNNLAQNTAYKGFDGTFTTSSRNNISDHSDAPGSNAKYKVAINFVDAANRDLHLASLYSAARDTGVDLSADAHIAFNTDIDGQSRPRGLSWDIGADEDNYLQTDFTPPVISAFTMPTAANNTSVNITNFSATDAGVGVAAYMITESPLAPPVDDFRWSASAPTSYFFGDTGIRTVYAWVKDNEGNISNSVSQTADILINTLAVQPSYFGHDWNIRPNFPTVPFTGIRLWDSGVRWNQIEISNGVYDWTMLDAWLSDTSSNGKDLMYTFGGVPQWASMRPTEDCAWGYIGGAAPAYDVDSTDTLWKQYVTALVQHSLNSSTGHIKYYELWNEPNLSQYWTGTAAQMARMANDAYSIIHSLDPNAEVVGPSPSPSTASTISWLSAYFAAGASNAQDIIAYHPYPSPAGADPETSLSRIDSINSLMQSYGIGGKPIWGTEGSWGNNITLTSSQQAAWLAKQYILLLSKGIARNYWYAWDANGGNSTASSSSMWGALWDGINGIRSGGVAYAQVYNWLVGSVISQPFCTKGSDSTWTCNLTSYDGKTEQILWNSTTTKSIALNPIFTKYKTIDNSNINLISGNSVNIGNEPILVTTDYSAPVVTSFSMPSTSGNNTVNIASFVATSTLGAIKYLITESSSTPMINNANWSTTTPSNFVFSGSGNRTAYAWAKDSYGNISASLLASVVITLTSPTYTIGGFISGLTGTVVLQNNSGDNLSISANGSFTFATALNSSASYAVTVLTNPSNQTCSITSGSGTVSAANITSISVSCSTNSSGGGGGGGGSTPTDTTAPGIPTNFSAISTSTIVILSWTNPTDSDFAGVKLYRKLNSAPSSQTDSSATLIYQGKGTGFIDASAKIVGSTYYYSLYSYDNSANYSQPRTISIGLRVSTSSPIVSVPPITATTTIIILPTTSSGNNQATGTVTTLIGASGTTVNAVTSNEVQTLVVNAGFAPLTTAEVAVYKKIIALTSKILPDANKYLIADFIHYGTPTTIPLGSGERAGSIASFDSAFGRLPDSNLDWQDVVKIGNGRWTTQTSATAEARAKISFKKVYLRDPNMKQANDNAAVNIMAYGLRPAQRNTASEKTAILSFKYIFKKTPTTAVDWDEVRAIAYSGAKR